MRSRLLKRILSLLAAATLLFCLAPAALADAVDTSRSCTYTIRCEFGIPLNGMAFELYRVADVSGFAPTITAVAPFSAYPVSLDIREVSQWNVAAQTLKNFVAADSLTPAAAGTTGEDGTLTFAGLATGLYLVLGQKVTINEVEYQAAPFMVCLPGRTTDWVYTVESMPKISARSTSSPGRGVPSETSAPLPQEETPGDTIRILKAWNDMDSPDRPGSVVVTVYCDGAVYTTCTLSADNSWRAVVDVDLSHDWTVLEDVPEGYTLQITKEGNTFLLNNTLQQSFEESFEVEVENAAAPAARLPQLGLLWWPVPVLGLAGLICFLVSALLRRRGRQ